MVAEITKEYASFLVEGDNKNTKDDNLFSFNIELDLSMVPDVIPIQIYRPKDDNSKKIHEQIVLKDLDVGASEIFDVQNKGSKRHFVSSFSNIIIWFLMFIRILRGSF